MKKIVSIALALVLFGGIAACCRASFFSEKESKLTAEQTVSEVIVKNGYAESAETVVIIAEYSDGRLQNVTSRELRLESGEEKAVPFDRSGTYKAYVWDSVSEGIVRAAEKESGGTYKVDYSGQKGEYMNAKDEYKAGEEVVLYYYFVATDTNYYFYLDDAGISPKYDEKGYVISFIMPEHDVTLRCESKNTMEYEPEKEEEVMLVDFYRATVATVGGDGYDEAVLYRYSDTQAKLCTYHKYEGDKEELTETYIVPYKAVEECYEVIEKNRFREWKDRTDTAGITGAVIVVKFREDDGAYVRVSSENMPMDGDSQMYEVMSVMSKYINDEYKEK